jgi:hypothetical protein
VYCLSQGKEGKLYAGSNNNGVFISLDNGMQWTQSCTGFINSTVYSPVIESKNSILAPSFNGIFRSTNNGESWQQIAFRDTVILSLTVDPEGNIFAGSDISGIFWSTDHGLSWQHNLEKLTIICITIDQSNNYYAGTNSGLYRSTDYGNNWIKMGFFTGYVNSILAINDKTILACNLTSIYRSTDNGNNWVEVLSDVSPMSLKMDPFGNIYDVGFGVFRSTDYGITWKNILGDTMGYLTINSLGYIFVGSLDEGIHRTTDQGNYWSDFSGSMWNEYIMGLGVDSDNYLYAGTAGHGLFRTSNSTPVNRDRPKIPLTYNLHQNYPNPFNPSTRITYSIPKAGNISIKIYDIMGRELETLVNEYKNAGQYDVSFDASNICSGVYFYRLMVNDFVSIKKMVLLK